MKLDLNGDFRHYLIPMVTTELEADKPTALAVLTDADEIVTFGYFENAKAATDASNAVARAIETLTGRTAPVTADIDTLARNAATVFALIVTGAKKPAPAQATGSKEEQYNSDKFYGIVPRRAGFDKGEDA